MKLEVTKEKKVDKSQKGFTLLELLAVLIIMAALTMVAIPIFRNKGLEAKQAVHNQNIKILKKQANVYMLEHDVGSGIDITDKLVESGLVKEIPKNPLPQESEQSKPYKVKIDENGRIKINVNPVGTGEDTLFICNSPKLATGMVPVKFNGTDWIALDGNPDDNIDNEWYKYQGDIEDFEGMKSNEKWANIQLQDSDKSMFVWIPRYAYKIIGDNTDTKEDDKIQIEYLKGSSNNVSQGYIVHSAFNGGLTGIWVAKFEASKNSNNNVKVVPGVESWTGLSVNDIYNECISMDDESNEYGLLSSNVKTIMMRNRDWGAVAYLTEAIRDGEEVWINNNSGFITGSAGNSQSASQGTGTINNYKDEQCKKASTTGNVYGIYDMSGGAYEYVASYINNGNSSLSTNGAGLINASDDDKDKFTGSFDGTSEKAYSETLSQTVGMALHEITKNGVNSSTDTNSFRGYEDEQSFTYGSNPFFVRGGAYDNKCNAGIFATQSDCCSVLYSSNGGFRPVIISD